MAICIHLPTNARCQVVSLFKDSEGTFYTLKEIVDPGNFARTFTAREDKVRLEQTAEIIQMDAARTRRQEAIQEKTEPPPAPTPKRRKDERDENGLLRINDPGLSPTTLANSIIQGIGPVTAGRILELRDSLPNNRFNGLDDLKPIKGINWKAYAEQISFE